jgi:hypothetical protein
MVGVLMQYLVGFGLGMLLMNWEPTGVCPWDVDGRKYEERNKERRDKGRQEVGRKKGRTNAAATATCNNHTFTNSRSCILWMPYFGDGIIDIQVASS